METQKTETDKRGETNHEINKKIHNYDKKSKNTWNDHVASML